MCYYNGQRVTVEEGIQLKQLEKKVANFDFPDHQLQIGFDYGLNAVLKSNEAKNDFDIIQMEWGFLPSYLRTREDVNKMRHGYKDASGKFHPPITTLNAVCEDLLKPGKIYKEAALKRRCLVLSTGFYEWRHIYPLNKRTGVALKSANKIPYFISVKDKGYFFMAGIWQGWTDLSTGEYVETFAIVTTKANQLMEQIHNSKKRMPTILNEDLAYEWIFGDLDDNRILGIAATQFPSEEMEAYTIAKDFRSALEPAKLFEYEDVPELELNW